MNIVDNRMMTCLVLQLNGVNTDDAIKISKLNTLTNEEMIAECDNMIDMLQTSISNLSNLKRDILSR